MGVKIILFIVIVGGIIFFVFAAPKFFKDYDLKKGLNATSTEKIISSAQEAKIKAAPSAQSSIAISSEKKEIPDSRIPSGFAREQLSPFFEKIRIASASFSAGYNKPSTIRLYSRLESGDLPIDITGWRLKSNRYEFIISKAVEIYKPSGTNEEKNVILSSNNYVNIYSTTSAINKNLRLNKCMGYLENSFDFNPTLPQSCPMVYRSRYEIAYLSGQCQTYLFSLGGCKPVDVAFYNSLLTGTSEGNVCRAFLNTVGTYGNCFEKYSQDKDFLSTEWRLWVNIDILDSQHDRLDLFDNNGLLVSDYVY
mgnify:FL=1